VLAVVAALGLDRLPGARRGLWVAVVALAQLVLTAAAWGGFLTALDGHRPDGPAAPQPPAPLRRRGRVRPAGAAVPPTAGSL